MDVQPHHSKAAHLWTPVSRNALVIEQ